MTLDEYQQFAERYLKQGLSPKEEVTSYAMCLAEEAGEAVGAVNKFYYSKKSPDLMGELGDVLWCLTALATKFGFSLNDVAEHNLVKLKKRFPEGWTGDGGVR